MEQYVRLKCQQLRQFQKSFKISINTLSDRSEVVLGGSQFFSKGHKMLQKQNELRTYIVMPTKYFKRAILCRVNLTPC